VRISVCRCCVGWLLESIVGVDPQCITMDHSGSVGVDSQCITMVHSGSLLHSGCRRYVLPFLTSTLFMMIMASTFSVFDCTGYNG
jgi:hypothetical protein